MKEKTAFIPGPWIRSGHGFQVLTAGSERSICTLATRRGEPEEEQIATASLIAAAPDLYAACEAMLKGLKETTGEVGPGLAFELSLQLEAALAKARGGSDAE